MASLCWLNLCCCDGNCTFKFPCRDQFAPPLLGYPTLAQKLLLPPLRVKRFTRSWKMLRMQVTPACKFVSTAHAGCRVKHNKTKSVHPGCAPFIITDCHVLVKKGKPNMQPKCWSNTSIACLACYTAGIFPVSKLVDLFAFNHCLTIIQVDIVTCNNCILLSSHKFTTNCYHGNL